ncbi:hypothetical protein [Symbiobacterium thermophilum]|uniref:hypothetical protein n=1 Tax=Symbiobacterium thermophilum TaxID=2734 RepID=UPI0011D0DDA0|nr:hypothetical protein [Symbiobacterium thermophilum]
MKRTRLVALITGIVLLTGCGARTSTPHPAGAQTPGQGGGTSAQPEPPNAASGASFPSEPAEWPAGTAADPATHGSGREDAGYTIERIRAAAEHGRPVREVDLNGDGRVEGIIGALGEWHRDEVIVVDGGGAPLLILNDTLSSFSQGRVDLVAVPGVADAVLVNQVGDPGDWHSIQFIWMEGDRFVSPQGWLPKNSLAHGQGYTIRPDGTVDITGSLAGYTFVRQYRMEKAPPESSWPYQAVLVSQEVTPGPYPTSAADLLTAVFLARWYGLTDQLEQYIPDPVVREAFLNQEMDEIRYWPLPVQVGRLVEGETGPRIEPASPGDDGAVEFLAVVQQYEGGTYRTGRAVIATAEDGRMVVTDLEILEQGWSL